MGFGYGNATFRSKRADLARFAPAKQKRYLFGDHSNTCHVWAQQSSATHTGQSADGRIRFEGETIYSYGSHFPMARFVMRKGKRAVLFTTRSYSVTTGKHKSEARSALYGLNLPVFYVDDVARDPGELTIKELGRGVVAQAEAFARSTPWDISQALGIIKGAAVAANDLARFFGLRGRVKAPRIPAKVIEVVRARVARKQLRAAEKAERRRIENEAHDRQVRAEYVAGDHHHLRGQEWGFASTLTEAEHAAHDAAYAIIQADKVAAWREGKPVSWGYNEGESETMLRVKGDQVETSRGAEFPVTHAVRAWPIVKACKKTGREWRTNGHAIHLGSYHLDVIEADGTVKAGCHVVKWDEIERVAKELGLT